MKQYVNNSPFNIPNLNMNVKVEEVTNGLNLYYTLSCDRDFNHITFISNGKCYYTICGFIPYQNNMSNAIWDTYQRLKNQMMLELNAFKIRKLQQKQQNLKQLKLFNNY